MAGGASQARSTRGQALWGMEEEVRMHVTAPPRYAL